VRQRLTQLSGGWQEQSEQAAILWLVGGRRKSSLTVSSSSRSSRVQEAALEAEDAERGFCLLPFSKLVQTGETGPFRNSLNRTTTGSICTYANRYARVSCRSLMHNIAISMSSSSHESRESNIGVERGNEHDVADPPPIPVANKSLSASSVGRPRAVSKRVQSMTEVSTTTPSLQDCVVDVTFGTENSYYVSHVRRVRHSRLEISRTVLLHDIDAACVPAPQSLLDSAPLKWKALKSWAETVASECGEPLLWIDSVCARPHESVDQSLARLPLYLSGCDGLVVILGSSYAHRLWCIMEVFCFLRMGGSSDRVTVVPLHDENAGSDARQLDRSDLLLRAELAKLDAKSATCDRPGVERKLRKSILTGFDGYEPFNRLVRNTLIDRYKAARDAGNGQSISRADLEEQLQRQQAEHQAELDRVKAEMIAEHDAEIRRLTAEFEARLQAEHARHEAETTRREPATLAPHLKLQVDQDEGAICNDESLALAGEEAPHAASARTPHGTGEMRGGVGDRGTNEVRV